MRGGSRSTVTSPRAHSAARATASAWTGSARVGRAGQARRAPPPPAAPTAGHTACASVATACARNGGVGLSAPRLSQAAPTRSAAGRGAIVAPTARACASWATVVLVTTCAARTLLPHPDSSLNLYLYHSTSPSPSPSPSLSRSPLPSPSPSPSSQAGCADLLCKANCSSHGACTLSGCTCDGGWSGADCNTSPRRVKRAFLVEPRSLSAGPSPHHVCWARLLLLLLLVSTHP